MNLVCVNLNKVMKLCHFTFNFFFNFSNTTIDLKHDVQHGLQYPLSPLDVTEWAFKWVPSRVFPRLCARELFSRFLQHVREVSADVAWINHFQEEECARCAIAANKCSLALAGNSLTLLGASQWR